MKFSRQMISLVAIVITSLIAVISGYYDYKEKLSDKQGALDNERKRNDEYKNVIENTTTIIDSSKHIIGTQRKVIDQTEKIAQLQAVISNKNLQIIKLQGETLNNLTGGKNFPKLEFDVSGVGASCFVINDSDFPIRSLNIEIDQIIQAHVSPISQNSYRFPFDLKDIPSHTRQLFFVNNYQNIYPKVIYFLKITWLTGYYSGYIAATSDTLNSKTTVGASASYSKQFKFKNLIKVNDKYAKQGVMVPPKHRPPGMKTQDEIEHP